MIVDGFIYFSDSFANYNEKSGPHINTLDFSNGFISLEEILPGENVYRPYLVCGRTSLNELKTSDSYDEIRSAGSFHQEMSSSEGRHYSLGIFYDEIVGEIILVRDAFGVVPLYYCYLPGKFLAFSNNLNSLINICGAHYVPKVNGGHVAKFLTFGEANGTHTQETFYSGINSVPSGHRTIFTLETCFTEPYLRLNPERWSDIKDTADYGEIFQNLFSKSVKRAVEGHAVIGSHLSGGLDSSSLICEVRHLDPDKEIHSYYAETKTRLANEGKYVNKVVEHIGCHHHEILPSEHDLDKLILHTAIYGHPECMITSSAKHSSILEEVKKNTKSKILLIGHDGDSIVGHGIDEHLAKLLKDGDWELLVKALKERSRLVSLKYLCADWDTLTTDEQYRIFLENYFYKILAGKFRVLKSLDFMLCLMKIKKYFDIPVSYFLKRGLKTAFRKVASHGKVPKSILNKDHNFSTGKFGISDLALSLRGSLPEKYQFNFEDVYCKPAIEVSEQYFALGNYYGISLRFPFYDQELYEFSMSVPMSVKFGNGYGRGHLREGMYNILPEEIRLRTNKANFILYSRLSTLRLLSQGKAFLTDECKVWSYVDKSKFELSCELLADENQSNEVYTRVGFYVFRTIALSVWLDKF